MVSDNAFCSITFFFSVLLNKRERKEAFHTKNQTLVKHLKSQCVQEGKAVRLIFLSHILECRASRGDSHHLCSPPALLSRRTSINPFLLQKGKKGAREEVRKGEENIDQLHLVVTGNNQPTQRNFRSLNEVTRNPQNCDRWEQKVRPKTKLLCSQRGGRAGAESENMRTVLEETGSRRSVCPWHGTLRTPTPAFQTLHIQMKACSRLHIQALLALKFQVETPSPTPRCNEALGFLVSKMLRSVCCSRNGIRVPKLFPCICGNLLHVTGSNTNQGEINGLFKGQCYRNQLVMERNCQIHISSL